MHAELPQPDGVRAARAALEQHALDDRLCHEGVDHLADDGDDGVDWIDVVPEVARLLAGANDPGEAVKQRAGIGSYLGQGVRGGVVQDLALHQGRELGMEQEEPDVRLDEPPDRFGRRNGGHECGADLGGEAGDAAAEDGVVEVLLVREVVVEQGAVAAAPQRRCP